MKSATEQAMTASLTSTLLTGILTSVHHAYEIGYGAIVLALFVVVLPALSVQRYRQTGSRIALWVYGLLTAWLVVGFGLVDGFWNHTVKLLGLQLHALLSFHGGGAHGVQKAVMGNLVHEGTGILTFIIGTVAAYAGYKFMRLTRQSGMTTNNINTQPQG